MRVLEHLRNLDSLNYLKVEFVAGPSHLPAEIVQSITTVEVLECYNCNDLLSVWPNGITLQHLSRLRRLVVFDCSQVVSIGKDNEQQLPENLEILELFRCASLTCLPNDLRNLTCLQELILKNCPKVARLSGTRLEILSCNVSNLEKVEIKECPSLRNWSRGSFPNWLKKLSIKNCNKLEPVVFPPNRKVYLDELSIWDWLSMVLENLCFLQHLSIMNCTSENLLEKLWHLEISDCPLLKQRCRRDRGDYWPKIAGISCVDFCSL